MEVLPTIKCEPELNITQEVDDHGECSSSPKTTSTTNKTTRFVVNGNDPSVVSFAMDESDDPNENWQNQEESYEDSEEFISIDDDKAKSFLFNAMKTRSEVSTDDGDDESGMFLEPEIVLESNENEEIQFPGHHSKSVKSVSSLEGDDEDVIIIDDDDEDEIMYEDPEDIDENEDGVELNWMDLERNHDEQFEFANQNSQKKDSVKDPNGTEFECNLCNKKVASSYNLRRHMMIHTGERPFGCDICYKRFREFSDLKKHRKVHQNEINFKCMVCHVNTPSPTNPTKCSSCDKKSARNNSSSSICDSVENVASTDDSKRKAFVCPVCDRIFGSRHNLKRHFMIHTGEKPFTCDICTKSFRELSTLKKHMLTHTRSRLFRCTLCDLDFSDYSSYSRHNQLHDDQTSGKGDSDVVVLDDEEGEDSGDNKEELEFECNECRMKFSKLTHYTEHLKVHTMSFSFQCYICKRMFKCKEKLNAHFVTHDTDDNSPFPNSHFNVLKHQTATGKKIK